MRKVVRKKKKEKQGGERGTKGGRRKVRVSGERREERVSEGEGERG